MAVVETLVPLMPAVASPGRCLRAKGRLSAVRAAIAPRVFSAQVEVGDEMELIPAFAIALSGCNMRCVFCITGDASWHAARGAEIDTVALAARAAHAVKSGVAKTILILGGEPTVHLPWLLEFVTHLPDDARLILKTNGLSPSPARELLDGLFDVWLVDFKFGNDRCAVALSGTSGYRGAVEETLLWADARADLIVRHLLMPGHVACCWKPVAAWIAEHLPRTKVSLRFGYWPAWKAERIPGLGRPTTLAEQTEALAIAEEFRLRLIP